ncbi:MAG: transglycosylase SLT domain-containing protein, partial [Candidatus Acidiferrales bacterium]
QTGGAPASCDELARLGNATGDLEAEWRSYRARCALRDGNRARTEAELSALAAKFSGSEWHQEALLAAGNTALAANELKPAREYFRQLVAAGGAGAAVADAHWKLAWITHRGGDKAEAAKLFDDHLARFPDSQFFPRALFWRARLAAQRGEAPLAEQLLTQLRACAPRDYLAQRAERVLGSAKSAPAGSASAPCPERPALPGLTPISRKRLETATTLERLSLHEPAEAELEAALEQAAHPLVATARAQLAFSQQKYARATETFNRAFPAYWRYQLNDLPREAWEILFPRPYWELIVREAESNKLDPYLVAALIRQESRFESRAESSAGALGLMQLMPATARAVAGNRRLPRGRLTEPELNIRLGTRYLASLLRRFNGSLEKAVAAYNAGGTRIEEWASRGSTDEPAEFVENIPLRQTREFVYIVLRNYRFYRDLYAGEPAGGTPGAAGWMRPVGEEAVAAELSYP